MRLEFRGLNADDVEEVLGALEFEMDSDTQGYLVATGYYGTSEYKFGPRDNLLVIRVTGVKDLKEAPKELPDPDAEEKKSK